MASNSSSVGSAANFGRKLRQFAKVAGRENSASCARFNRRLRMAVDSRACTRRFFRRRQGHAIHVTLFQDGDASVDYFPEVTKVPFEGPQSRNPLAFRHYNADEVVEGKTLRDHLRFSVCYWHTFRATGADPFGAPTLLRPWDDGSESIENAKRRVDAAFEFMSKLGAPFYCFHDRDVAPDGSTLMAANQQPRGDRAPV
jgi:hypothetical protein